MTEPSKCIIIFPSIHDVVAAECFMKGNKIWCDMIPTPRQVSGNCGMVLEIMETDLDCVLGIDGYSSLRVLGIFRCAGDSYVILERTS